jgi:hypothetical protein
MLCAASVDGIHTKSASITPATAPRFLLVMHSS